MVHHDFHELHSSLLKIKFPKNSNYHLKNVKMLDMLIVILILINLHLLILVSFYKLL